MRKVKDMAPWTHKFVTRGLVVAGAILLATMALAPTASAQVVISLTPPVCAYGYYDYQPYACAPMGFYGPGYFYGGIFLGVGPWGNWGYSHGWGGHRFNGGGGGVYVAHGYGGSHGGGYHGSSHTTVVHSGNYNGASHSSAVHGGSSHNSGGGGSHGGGGGGSHGGGGGGSHGGGGHR